LSCRQGTRLRRKQGSECGGGDNRIHNTPSTKPRTVTVFCLFHPLHSRTLPVARAPRNEDGCVLVVDPSGSRLKIPCWMLTSSASQFLSDPSRYRISLIRVPSQDSFITRAKPNPIRRQLRFAFLPAGFPLLSPRPGGERFLTQNTTHGKDGRDKSVEIKAL
jgi:hypothetical protein